MSSKKNQDGDQRFLRVQKDPRFWEMPERERKVKIDKRFRSMFHDKRFKVRYTVDKRGRPINHTSADDLKRFYELSDSEEDEEEEEDAWSKKATEGKEKKEKEKKPVEAKRREKRGKAVQSGGREDEEEKPERGVRVVEAEDKTEDEEEDVIGRGDAVSDSSEEDDDGDEEESDVCSGSDSDSEDNDSGPDLARGKGNVETSSDEDDEDDVDAILRKEEEQIEHDWGELCKDAPRSDEVSARLAVCNMDWDRMKARDLLALVNSFTPKGGAVLSVKIYPSEFGRERLKAEETQGPMELRVLPDDSEDDTEEEKVHREKIRDYQFKRLRYYYAVVECDSADTAARIYDECDGYEYESSCSVLDLRFIPDTVMFDEEPKDVATDVNLSAYAPKLFTSSATATSKVQLTWDETDHERVAALNRKFDKNELLEMDLNAYLASSSEEEEEEDDEDDAGAELGDDIGTAEAERREERVVVKPQREEEEEEENRKKKKKKKSEEQISKYRELLRGIQDKEKKLQEDKDMEMEITWVPGLRETTEQLVKKRMEAKEQLTPWEEFLQKKKERKRQKKTQSKQEVAEAELSDDELPPDVDLSDPFYAEELEATDLKKKQKGKKKKKQQQEEEERTAEEEEELEKRKAEIALLMEDDAADDAKHKHFNYDKIVEQQNLSKKKRKRLLKKGEEPEDDDFQVDVKDPRFQAMFTSHLFNLDPSHPSYKKTKATQSILAEKRRLRAEEEERLHKEDVLCAQTAAPTQAEPGGGGGKKQEKDLDAPAAAKTTSSSMDPSLSLLVKSIKSKTEQFQARKKQKLV